MFALELAGGCNWSRVELVTLYNLQVTDMRQRHTQLVQDVADLERQLEAKRKEGV